MKRRRPNVEVLSASLLWCLWFLSLLSDPSKQCFIAALDIPDGTVWSPRTLQTSEVDLTEDVLVLEPFSTFIIRGDSPSQPLKIRFRTSDVSIVVGTQVELTLQDVILEGVNDTASATPFGPVKIGRGIVGVAGQTPALLNVTRVQCIGLQSCLSLYDDGFASPMEVRDSLVVGCQYGIRHVRRVENSIFLGNFLALSQSYSADVINCTWARNEVAIRSSGTGSMVQGMRDMVFMENGVGLDEADSMFLLRNVLFFKNERGTTGTFVPLGVSFYQNGIAIDEGRENLGLTDSFYGGVALNLMESRVYHVNYQGTSLLDLREAPVHWGSTNDEVVAARLWDGRDRREEGGGIILFDAGAVPTPFVHDLFPAPNHVPPSLLELLGEDFPPQWIPPLPVSRNPLPPAPELPEDGDEDNDNDNVCGERPQTKFTLISTNSKQRTRTRNDRTVQTTVTKRVISEYSCAWLKRRQEDSRRQGLCHSPHSTANVACPVTCGTC